MSRQYSAYRVAVLHRHQFVFKSLKAQHVHLVFGTKRRRGVFTKQVLDHLHAISTSVCIDFDAELAEFDGEEDHVHLLVNYPPKVAVSALANSLKGVSSRMARKKNCPSIRNKLWDGALWPPSCFAGSCGSAPIPDHAPVHRATANATLGDYNAHALLPRPEGRGL